MVYNVRIAEHKLAIKKSKFEENIRSRFCEFISCNSEKKAETVFHRFILILSNSNKCILNK